MDDAAYRAERRKRYYDAHCEALLYSRRIPMHSSRLVVERCDYRKKNQDLVRFKGQNNYFVMPRRKLDKYGNPERRLPCYNNYNQVIRRRPLDKLRVRRRKLAPIKEVTFEEEAFIDDEEPIPSDPHKEEYPKLDTRIGVGRGQNLVRSSSQCSVVTLQPRLHDPVILTVDSDEENRVDSMAALFQSSVAAFLNSFLPTRFF